MPGRSTFAALLSGAAGGANRALELQLQMQFAREIQAARERAFMDRLQEEFRLRGEESEARFGREEEAAAKAQLRAAGLELSKLGGRGGRLFPEDSPERKILGEVRRASRRDIRRERLDDDVETFETLAAKSPGFGMSEEEFRRLNKTERSRVMARLRQQAAQRESDFTDLQTRLLEAQIDAEGRRGMPDAADDARARQQEFGDLANWIAKLDDDIRGISEMGPMTPEAEEHLGTLRNTRNAVARRMQALSPTMGLVPPSEPGIEPPLDETPTSSFELPERLRRYAEGYRAALENNTMDVHEVRTSLNEERRRGVALTEGDINLIVAHLTKVTGRREGRIPRAIVGAAESLGRRIADPSGARAALRERRGVAPDVEVSEAGLERLRQLRDTFDYPGASRGAREVAARLDRQIREIERQLGLVE